MKASFPDRSREHRSEPVTPEPNRLVADIDPPLVEQILDLSQRKRIADVHHHHEADHLGRRVEIAEGILHRRTLKKRDRSLKPIYSDIAFRAYGGETVEVKYREQVNVSPFECETVTRSNFILHVCCPSWRMS